MKKIDRYIGGVADESEIKYAESLFINGENNLYLRNLLREDWEYMLKGGSSASIDLNHLLDRIHTKIRKDEKSRRNRTLHKILRIYMKVAAILILPISIAGSLVLRNFSQGSIIEPAQIVTAMISAPMGARVSFNLPDGTIGMLNSGSHLRYSMPFTNRRHVNLDGEAWFVVKSDTDNPFEISAGSSTVKALGTSFNLSANKDEDFTEIVLKEGKIEFEYDKGTRKIIILPSERLVYQAGKTTTQIVDVEKYNSWTQGMLVFRGDPMSEVVRRLERWYNVKIDIKDKELEKYSFRGTFQDDSLDDVLKYLAMTSPISYKISPREIMPDGTYTKEKVTISKIH